MLVSNMYSLCSCAMKADRTVYCFELGQFTPLPPATGFRSIAAGNYHTCALRVDNTAVCFGLSSQGQTSPSAVRFLALSAGGEFTCGLLENKRALCFGDNSRSQLQAPNVPFESVSLAHNFACGIVAGSAAIQCWCATDIAYHIITFCLQGSSRAAAKRTVCCACTRL